MKCKFCQKSAGLFHSAHKECVQKHDEAKKLIAQTTVELLCADSPTPLTYDFLNNQLIPIKQSGYLTDAQAEEIAIDSLYNTIRKSARVNAFRLFDFISSIPYAIRKQILASRDYELYWEVFFENYFASMNDNVQVDDDYKRLLVKLKQEQNLSDAIDVVAERILQHKIYKALEDGIIEEVEEEQIGNFIEQSSITQAALHKSQAYQKLVQSLVLRDIKEGREIERLKINNLPLLLGKNEFPIWVFQEVNAYEEKTGRKYVGGSRGTNIRICKGVYYRIGATKGQSVEYQYQNFLGKGHLIVTNKNLYFIGVKQLKLPIAKILTYEPYSDGIMLVKDGANPKPYTFVGFDPWFIVNAINLLVD